MPKLVHFTDEQKGEVREEIATFLKPYRIRFWAIILGFIIGATIGLYGYKNAVDSATHNSCVQDRQLIIGIILRNVDKTYTQYRTDPSGVIASYKKVLEGNPTYKNNPKLLNSTLKKTQDILDASDPVNCPG